MPNISKRYTSSAEIQNYWLTDIAPNYFDFDNVNNYRTGIFGYINEVMSTATMDVHNAINIARREFYPVSAQFSKSLYKMAALQKIDLPLTTPAMCSATLLLDRDEVIENSTRRDGMYTCVIDSTAELFADNMQFSLVYPIVIISNISNGEWSHTIHYDKSNRITLDSLIPSNYYLTHRTIMIDGRSYLLIGVNLLQMAKEEISQLVTTDSLVQTVSILYEFEGDLAGFEAYYIEDPDASTPIQLTKLMQGQAMIETPFCYYKMLTSNSIELTFPRNIYFTPALNSEIRLDVYTSNGIDGNFDSFTGSLSCSMDSETYPYNNNMTMMGLINGSSVNGRNRPTQEEYTKTLQDAYATNNTFTTTNDLQIKFDSLSSDKNNRILFRKKRMDAFSREYGAYMLLKDTNGNVVPTNTLSVSMKLNEFDTYNGMTERAYIKPGTIFEYDPASDNSAIYTGRRVSDLKLSDDLSAYDESSSEFLYTNPFLISVNLNPNLIGYYNNSINTTHSIEYTYINDSTVVQFIGNGISVYRNSIAGENYYKFSMVISPTSTVEPLEIVSVPSEASDEDYYIRAAENGRVISMEYDGETVTCTVLYASGEEDTIIANSYIEKDGEEYTYVTGYTLQVAIYDTFTEGDILAVKKVTDLGKIRACLNFKNILYDNNLYVPMVIEDYNEETTAFTICGYISTDDTMDGDSILVDTGIYNIDGNEDENVNITYGNLVVEVGVFYKNDDVNYAHKYSAYDYFRSHTLTNIYADNTEDGISLVENIKFIKSTIVYTEDPNEEGDEDEYNINIKEIPFTKTTWIKSESNFSYLINTLMLNYNKLQDISFDLENNYSIDLKFYNTYGKSKFFRVGAKSEWSPLKHVNCSFNFGAHINSVSTESSFLEDFRDYVKEAVESINSTSSGQSIYILNLTYNIINKFSELGYIEYYGFDEYSSDVQKIVPIPNSELSDELLANYIPEFINICTHVENGENVPNVNVEFLDTVE